MVFNSQKKQLSSQCASLFEELIAGRSSALEDIYDLAGRQMFTVAYNIVGDYQLAEDALQDGLLQIYKNSSQLKDVSKALSWMLTIINNAACAIIRKRKAEIPSEDTELIAQSDAAGKVVEDLSKNADDSLKKAMESLDPDSRNIVILKTVMGYTYIEISQITGISVANCQKKHQRALKHLKELLG